MIIAALTGVAGGALMAAALAGLRRTHNWPKAGRVTAIGGLLAGVATVLSLVWLPVAAGAPAAYAAIAIAAGGLALAVVEKAPPWVLLASGVLLIYATLAPSVIAAPPVSLAAVAIIVASAETLPGLDAAVRAWRGSLDPTRIALWLGISIALAASAAASLLDRGAWLSSAPGNAWLTAAWITSSGSLLVQRSRWRAALMSAAALGIGLCALSL